MHQCSGRACQGLRTLYSACDRRFASHPSTAPSRLRLRTDCTRTLAQKTLRRAAKKQCWRWRQYWEAQALPGTHEKESTRSLNVCAHRDRIGRVARHLVEGRVGDAHVELALPLAAPVRVAPLPLAQVVPVVPQPDACHSG